MALCATRRRHLILPAWCVPVPALKELRGRGHRTTPLSAISAIALLPRLGSGSLPRKAGRFEFQRDRQQLSHRIGRTANIQHPAKNRARIGFGASLTQSVFTSPVDRISPAAPRNTEATAHELDASKQSATLPIAASEITVAESANEQNAADGQLSDINEFCEEVEADEPYLLVDGDVNAKPSLQTLRPVAPQRVDNDGAGEGGAWR
jgi:hypothetical protein